MITARCWLVRGGGLVTAASAFPSLACAPAPISTDAAASIDAARPPENDAGSRADAGFVCPPEGVWGPGRHRLFVQGHEAPPRADGTWPFLHERRPDGSDAELCDDAVFANDTSGDGLWQPGEEPRSLGPSALVHGEHFLVGPGAFVEISTTLCADITGEVTLYLPNFDQEGSVALHELVVVHADGRESLIVEATDDEPGFSGYNPFVRVLSGTDPLVAPGDRLVLRSTNVSGAHFSVMVWRPPSEYESWIVVEVP